MNALDETLMIISKVFFVVLLIVFLVVLVYVISLEISFRRYRKRLREMAEYQADMRHRGKDVDTQNFS